MPRILTPCLIVILSLFASLAIYAQQLIWSPLSSAPNSGVWSSSDANWWTSSGFSGWLNGTASHALFTNPAGTVSVLGDLQAGELRFHGDDYVFNFAEGASLHARKLEKAHTYRFAGAIAHGSPIQYPSLVSLKSQGLHLYPGDTELTLSGRLEPQNGGSPVLGVHGGHVRFRGTWMANTGSIIPWLALSEGGKITVLDRAEFNFIKLDGFYTLQLWVQGDGTGTLELAEGFIADRTEGGKVAAGIGAIRLSNTTFITHHSQSLPIGYRPGASDTAQANGHLVFEQDAGSRWITRSNPQEYHGAVWIYRDMTFETVTDLVHTGTTESISDYTAYNGFSALGPVALTKQGSASLILAGEQSYDAGASWIVEAGALVFATPPAQGFRFGGAQAQPHLALDINAGGSADFQKASRIQSLEVSGKLSVGESLEVLGNSPVSWHEQSITEITLADVNQDQPLIKTAGSATLSGTLMVWRSPDHFPATGSRWLVLEAAAGYSGSWQVDDYTDLGLQLQQEGNRLFLVSNREALGVAGEVLLEDHFNDIAQWDDLSLVPEWGTPLHVHSAFQLENGQVQLNRLGEHSIVNYIPYGNANSLKSFTSLDHQFTEPISHAGNTLTVDFVVAWENPTFGQGEEGRFMIVFNHDYPEGGLDLTPATQPESRWNDFSADWWARPAYHVRLRSSQTAPSFLQYGGGYDAQGEYERTQNWWLPGFISGAGQVSPGQGGDFPLNSWVSTKSGMARTQPTLFRYIITPDRQELWRDDNDDGWLTDDELKAVMPLPRESSAPLYEYFETFEGLRLYWAGGQVYLDWLRLIVNDNEAPQADAGDGGIRYIELGNELNLLLDARATSDPESDPLFYMWWLNGEVVLQTHSPVSTISVGEGRHTFTLWTVDSAGNVGVDEVSYEVTKGNLSPRAHAGEDQTLAANEQLYATFNLDASDSIDPDGTIVEYLWTRANGTVELYRGTNPGFETTLNIGIHEITLTVTDDLGARSEDRIRITIIAPGTGTSEVIYRENFSRENNGLEMGPDRVGWKLMRTDGQPVAAIHQDGNAHRSLSENNFVTRLPKVNANPTGAEYDPDNGGGHMWMNQMPFNSATPAQWFLWTDEYSIDPQKTEISSVEFHASDRSPEVVDNALAVRVGDDWYIQWDARVPSNGGAQWRLYTLDYSPNGWYLFDPSPTFTITNATYVEQLPDGLITAFGLYFYKEYGWYVNRVDNFTIYARERIQVPPAQLWRARYFSPAELADSSLEDTRWGDLADPDQDGWVNQLEYALGSHPLVRDGLRLRVTGGQLMLPFTLNPEAAQDVEVRLEKSDNLLKWDTVPATSWQFVRTDSEGLQHWQVPVMTSGTALYYRIQLAEPPR